MEAAKRTQAERVLDYIMEFGSITQIDALRDIGCMRLASRISDLRKQGVDIISKTDKRRASYYNFYTGQKWGKYDNYDLTVNSSTLGIDGVVNTIVDLAKKMMD